MSASDYVVFSSGLALPLAALRLAWELEARGLHLGADGEMLTLGPRDLITDEDRARVRRWKPHLLAIVALANAPGGVQ